MKNHIASAFLFGLMVTGLSAAASAQGTKVTLAKVNVAAGLLDYRGRCPVDVPITGVIQTSGPGLVRYQFLHSLGASGPVQQLISLFGRSYDVRENPARNYKADAPPWNDTVTLRILTNPEGNFDSASVKYVGACETVTAVPQVATASVYYGPAQATFRVTINGFTCNTPTSDGVLMADGAGDEVFMFTRSYKVQLAKNGVDIDSTTSGVRLSFQYGDIGNGQQHGSRVRAGSSSYFGSNGGIVAGDTYPLRSERHSTDPQSQTLPQNVWQGTISRFTNGVIIVPMIWESDGTSDLQGPFQYLNLERTPFTFSQMIKDPTRTDQTGAEFALRADFDRIRPLEHRLIPQDKPIGYREAGGLRFKAEALFLTYDEALRMSEAHRATGKAVPITYASAPDAGGGSYTIWVQVERLP